MKTIDSKRSERFKGKYYKFAYLKCSEGPSFRLHPQILDPREDFYFMNHLKRFKTFNLRSITEPSLVKKIVVNENNQNDDNNNEKIQEEEEQKAQSFA